MEVIAFHFVPPEEMQRKKDGTLESVPNAALRRVFHAQSGESTMPEVKRFDVEGRYSLSLTQENSDQVNLIIAEKKSKVVMKKIGARRTHKLVDIKGNNLARKHVAVLTDTYIGNMRGIGIVKQQNKSYLLEWYVYNLEYFIKK